MDTFSAILSALFTFIPVICFSAVAYIAIEKGYIAFAVFAVIAGLLALPRFKISTSREKTDDDKDKKDDETSIKY